MVVTMTVLVRFLSAHLCVQSILQNAVECTCQVIICMLQDQLPCLQTSVQFAFISAFYCIAFFSVEINCQYICIEFSSKPLRKYFLELQIHDTLTLASNIFLYTFCVGKPSWMTAYQPSRSISLGVSRFHIVNKQM